ncbi:GNAT family N-acetyltransferase [Halomonas kalidii]|uniref:GNAT family N-acetyltransferase n=1 Tax=Halomonas kalidii TaxID=3043293 RepID=A0ABT6VP89_9GAMM|nr:GNAT family N-acetyltransferase [Halomonas kalidii]MDI5935813.1 GNAT family N-acetyltransferase [Halomonas kalidii]
MKLRSMEREDLKACARLYARVFAAAPWNEPWDAELALRRLAHFEASSGFLGMVAEGHDETGEVLGFALGNLEPFCRGTLFYLREMCVGTAWQSRGVGTALYRALEARLHGHQAQALYLATDRGIPAAAFYSGLGFRRSENMAFYAKRLAGEGACPRVADDRPSPDPQMGDPTG